MKIKLINLINEITGKNIDVIDIPINIDLVNYFGIDSIQMINLLLKIEDEFDVRIDYDNLNYNDIRYLDKILALIQEYKNIQ